MPKKVNENLRHLYVLGTISAITHGDQVYPVKDGAVDLPAAEEWWKDLKNAGLLSMAPEEAK